jgi:hypothetical protein
MLEPILKYLLADFVVMFAAIFNNPFGKRYDVHGRSYKTVYKRFGHGVMVHDYLNANSWNVRV